MRPVIRTISTFSLKNSMLILLFTVCGFLGTINTLPTIATDNIKDKRCISIQETQRFSPSKYSKVPKNETERKQYCLVDETYLGLDIYPCDDFFRKSIRQECLMCGQPIPETQNKPLCPKNSRDDPDLHLTCEYCRRFANPCHNGGTAVCSTEAYASELKCSCAPGFSGRFCEFAFEEVIHICTLEEDDDELPSCDGNQLSTCKMTFIGRDYKCVLHEDDDDIWSLRRCDTVPLMLPEDLVEHSAEGSSDTQDENAMEKIVLQEPAPEDSGFLIDVPMEKEEEWNNSNSTTV